MVGRKDELAKVDGQLLSDLVRYGGIGPFVHHVPFVLAILEFFVRHPRRRRLARGDRCTAHEFIEARIGENERKIDGFVPRVLNADPRIRRDENNSSGRGRHVLAFLAKRARCLFGSTRSRPGRGAYALG